MTSPFVRTLFLALCPALLLAGPARVPAPAPAPVPAPVPAPEADPHAVGVAALNAPGTYNFGNALEEDIFFIVDRDQPEDDSTVYYKVGVGLHIQHNVHGPVQTIEGHDIGNIQVAPGHHIQMNVAPGAGGVRVRMERAGGQQLPGFQLPFQPPQNAFQLGF
jgi:hypothetical protein